MKSDRAGSQSESIRRAIERDIFNGKLRPGSPLDEDQIAKKFGVSRTPVREAILQLAHSGIVEKLPRKGSIVARIDIHKLILLFELMSELEAICARLATRRMTAAERQKLAELHRKSEEAYRAGDQDAYYDFSHRFHMQIIQGTHNEEIINTLNRVGIQLVPYRRFQLRYPGRSEANLQGHKAVLDAILTCDADTASEVFKQHTTVQGDALAEYVSMGAADPLSDAEVNSGAAATGGGA
ncbi:GntR family transcriptional regulator [Actibacterium sp. D379-3]